MQSAGDVNYDLSGEVKDLARTLHAQEGNGGIARQISAIDAKRERIVADIKWISNELDIESKECEQARVSWYLKLIVSSNASSRCSTPTFRSRHQLDTQRSGASSSSRTRMHSRR